MRIEIRRQAVHLSGIIFIFLAQFIGNIIFAYFFIIALAFLLWSLHIQKIEKRSAHLLKRLEHKFRDFALGFEREEAKPFSGAAWFFFSCGLTFLIFPLQVASAACMILAVGDAFSTLVGKTIGKRKIMGKKTLEGSIAFLLTGAIAAWLFVPLSVALIGTLVGTIAEMLFGHDILENANRRGLISDNLAVPLASAAVMFLSVVF